MVGFMRPFRLRRFAFILDGMTEQIATSSKMTKQAKAGPKAAGTKGGKRTESDLKLPSGAEKTRQLVMQAARSEFAARGLAGARVDVIARRAGVNKQALYYHFGNKEELFRTALIGGYEATRQRNLMLDVSELAPEAALRRIIDDMFVRIKDNRDMMALILDENRFAGKHVASPIRHVIEPLLRNIGDAISRGEKVGVFRTGLKADQLYIDIVSMCMLYFSNIHTMSALLGKTLDTPAAVAKRRRHVAEFILAAVRRS